MLTIFTIVTDECGTLIALDPEGAELASLHVDEVDPFLSDYARAMRHMELVCQAATVAVNQEG